MHTLYSFPFSCALAVQITLDRHAIPYTLETVDRGPNRKVGTEGFASINAKQKVPTLVLPDGEILTEIVAILYVLDQEHAPLAGAAVRRRLEWLAYLATELHQQILGPAFDPETPADTIEDLGRRFVEPVVADLTRALADRETLLGGPLDGADAYLLWGLSLLRFRWPEALSVPLSTYLARGMADPVVRSVFAPTDAGG